MAVGWISRKASSLSIYRNHLFRGFGGAKGVTTSSDEDPSEEYNYPHEILPWYSSISSPWLMLPPRINDVKNMFYHFHPVAEKGFVSVVERFGFGRTFDSENEFVGSSHGWLAVFNKRNGDLFLSNPLTRHHIKLPPIDAMTSHIPIPKEDLTRVKKVVISCSPHDEECIAMMIFGRRDRLAFCFPAHRHFMEMGWAPIGHGAAYSDCVYSITDQAYFCITKFQEIQSWDLRDPSSPIMIPLEYDVVEDRNYSDKNEEFKFKSCYTQEFLVHSGSQTRPRLFSVTQFIMDKGFIMGGGEVRCNFPHKTIGFNVYKYEDGKKRYIENGEGSLDGMALLIGLNHSLAVEVPLYEKVEIGAQKRIVLVAESLKSNSIYFTDSQPIPRKNYEYRIFNYEDGTFSSFSCLYLFDAQSLVKMHSALMWFTPITK